MRHGLQRKKTVISRANGDKDSLKRAKATVLKVCTLVISMEKDDRAKHSLDQLLKLANVSKVDYEEALKLFRGKANITYKRRPNEMFISPYNTVIMANLKANMNIQYITSAYAVLAYLTSYLCKPEHTLGELMRKAVKEVNEAGVGNKLRAIGNVFITAREVSFQESTYHLLSHPFRHSNVDVQYIATGPKKQRTRVLKPRAVLETMDDDDTDVFAVGPIEKYENRPDVLEEMCLADFITNYRHKSTTDADSVEENTIEGYFKPVAGYTNDDNDDNGILIDKAPCVIKLKNDLGEMKKRIRPCVPRTHKVSKDSSPEEYYMKLLQLYWPWRDEIDLKHSDGTYTSKFNEVKYVIDDTISRFERYDKITEEDLEHGYTISSED